MPTLTEVKLTTGRVADLISASDGATIEAAMRLYKQIDIVVVEKTAATKTGIRLLHVARTLHPRAKRVLLVETDALADAYSAVHDGTVDVMLFKPFRLDQLREAFGLPALGDGVNSRIDAVVRRIHAHPPLTGGSSASSSPLARR
ncbi:MAG: hypothetical protein H7144_13180 [Burkholderiales bacterium]|nr:hypothetical protein [Phycisphaerae bacterium]